MDVSVEEGGHRIPYEIEDPSVHRDFEAELARNGVRVQDGEGASLLHLQVTGEESGANSPVLGLIDQLVRYSPGIPATKSA